MSNNHMSSCYSLSQGEWMRENNLGDPRSVAAGSQAPGGFMISGGINAKGRPFSTEIFNNGVWTCGPSIPVSLKGHCQVQVGDKVIIAG